MTKFQKSLIFKIVLIALVVALDLLTKLAFFSESFTVLPTVIGVRALSTLNTGGAWGILADSLPFLIIITLFFLAGAVFVERHFRQTHPLYVLSFAFIVGGALGNFSDRIFLGGVRDFIFFEFWHTFPTFNLADSFLSIGMLLLVIFTLFFYKPNNDNSTSQNPAKTPPETPSQKPSQNPAKTPPQKSSQNPVKKSSQNPSKNKTNPSTQNPSKNKINPSTQNPSKNKINPSTQNLSSKAKKK